MKEGALYWQALSASHNPGSTLPLLEPNEEGALRRLVHELRQPLSTMEAITCLIQISTQDPSDRLSEQCLRLLQLIHHADWLIEDAALITRAAEISGSWFPLPDIIEQLLVTDIDDQCAPLEFDGHVGPIQVFLPVVQPVHVFEHLIAFMRDVAQSQSPVLVFVEPADDEVVVRCSAKPNGIEPEGLMQLLDPTAPPSGIRRMIEVLGGTYQVSVLDSHIVAECRLRAMPD